MSVSKLTRRVSVFTALALLAIAAPSAANAQWAETGVDLGNGFAGANASADGQWTLVDSTSKVDGSNSFGHGFGIGVGPNGISVSNSVGVNTAQGGVGHNFNMTNGQNGPHFSESGDVRQGGATRVIAGGGSGQYGGGISGGSSATGYGDYVDAYSRSNTQQNPRFMPRVYYGR